MCDLSHYYTVVPSVFCVVAEDCLCPPNSSDSVTTHYMSVALCSFCSPVWRLSQTSFYIPESVLPQGKEVEGMGKKWRWSLIFEDVHIAIMSHSVSSF